MFARPPDGTTLHQAWFGLVEPERRCYGLSIWPIDPTSIYPSRRVDFYAKPESRCPDDV
jgi:hypothetical protein